MLLFIKRLLLKSIVFLLRDLPLILIGVIVLVPVVVINRYLVQANYKSSWKLPYLFRWFDNADLYDEFNRNAVTYLCIVLPKGSLYTYYWLAIRNPLNYFNYRYSAVTPQKIVTVKELVNTGDVDNNQGGYRHSEVEIDGKSYYEYYYIGQYITFRLGWKIGMPDEIKFKNPIQDVFNIRAR